MTLPAKHEHPVLAGEHTFASVGDHVVDIPLRFPYPWRFLAVLGFASSLVLVLVTAIAYLFVRGVGIWGVNVPVAWGFAIINFVWWIGIGHAGTLISAILLLLRQPWRTSINRFAEAMTLFAVANAGIFPLLHLGRWHKFYYILPYPDTMGLWPQWRSPLVYDVIAVMTYGLISLIFWYVGLVPDLATMRDRAAKTWSRRLAGVFALGWRGDARHWQRYQMAYLLLAGLATPLVVSVHSIVSFDFAVAIVPGWHSTIFPPYFVAGAIYSGFAMVFTILVPLRRLFGLQSIVTLRHFDAMGKVFLASGLVVAYGYLMEYFWGWYSGDEFERYMLKDRLLGGYAPAFWLVLICNVVVGQALWFKKIRTNPPAIFLVSILVNVGMWAERYVIIVQSLHRDFMPSAWGWYSPTVWDWLTFIGTLGFFSFLMLLFVRFIPMSSVSELRELLHHERGPAAQVQSSQHEFDEQPTQPRVASSENLYGLVAEFADPDLLKQAARRVREDGYQRVRAYSPYPIEGLDEALGLGRTAVSLIVLGGALTGAVFIYLLQWYTATIDYPFQIGGRPLHSWPSFIPLTFEVAVLFGGFSALLGMLALNGLPRLSHPIFNAPGFERASRDRFFLCVRSHDSRFDPDRTRAFLRSLQPLRVSDVPLER